MTLEKSELISDVREQVLYMQELGVETLEVDFPEPISVSAPKIVEQTNQVIERYIPETPIFAKPTAKPIETPPPTISRLSRLPSIGTRPIINSNLGKIQPPREEIEMPKVKTETPAELPNILPISNETLADIKADIGDCKRCNLCEGRKNIAHSKGSLTAKLMFIGEAPGADEDEQGEPFVGRAGQLLTKIIEGINYKREDVFIGNINRCRPPGNRQPLPAEVVECKPFLLREIAVVRPKVVVVMGNTACQNLLGTKIGISKIRGEFQDYYGVKVMPTFHPAYLLRDPHKKREVWEDMKKVRDYLAKV
jgi:uracil-DNA glycosylase